MKLLFIFPLLTLFCNPGTIADYEHNKRFILKCNEPECNYTIDLEIGFYIYITENKEDYISNLKLDI